jgi:hypothetical protein
LIAVSIDVVVNRFRKLNLLKQLVR